jgi:hypothetical protein
LPSIVPHVDPVRELRAGLHGFVRSNRASKEERGLQLPGGEVRAAAVLCRVNQQFDCPVCTEN